MARYPTIQDGEWIIPKGGKMRLACCDCGLVHDMEVSTNTVNGEPAFRLIRNNRSTAAMRRGASEGEASTGEIATRTRGTE